MLFLRDTQLVLRSSILTVLDLDEVDVTLKNLESFESVLFGGVDLLMAGGAANLLLVFFSCPMPLLRIHPLSLLACRFFVLAEIGATSTHWHGWRVTLFLSEKRGGKSHFGIILVSAVSRVWRYCIAIRSLLPMSMQTKQAPKEPVLLVALEIMLHAKLSRSVIVFLICVC